MDLQKAKILLEKINALYKSMSADAKNISTIERDLMRSYITQLYEAFLNMPASTVAPEAPPVEIIKSSSPRLTLNRPEPAPKAPEPPVAAPPTPPQPTPPPRVEAPVAVKITPPPPPPPPPPPRPQPAPVPVVVNEEIEELFAFTSARELGEKLSEQPISDIKKAMSINDRVLNTKELFGGDQAAFDATLDELNRLRSFEDAKNYLIQGVASKYNWVAKDRKPLAKNFIKLVKRKFS